MSSLPTQKASPVAVVFGHGGDGSSLSTAGHLVNGGNANGGGPAFSASSPPVARCVSSGPALVAAGNAVGIAVEDDAAIIAAPPDATTTDEPNPTRKVEDDDDEDETDDIVRTDTNGDLGAEGNNGRSNPEHRPGGEGEGDVDIDDASNNPHVHQENDDDDEEEDDDEYEYEYEDDEEAAYSGFLVPSGHAANLVVAESKDEEVGSSPARIEDEAMSVSESTRAGAKSSSSDDEDAEQQQLQRKKWREPSRAAVNMSLRAQKETTGSKRRLAQDLYRIMNQDTEEAGFSLTPQSEDSMDKWCIKLFKFDEDSNLAKDMMVLNIESIELEMSFPDQYPFAPPFVRVVRPRFKRQTGFVMAGALCMELLTNEGWNPINDIESVIVSVRSLLVVGDGRLQAATDLSKSKYDALLSAASGKSSGEEAQWKRQKLDDKDSNLKPPPKDAGAYTANEAKAAYTHLSDYHKKKGWDNSGWWARKG